MFLARTSSGTRRTSARPGTALWTLGLALGLTLATAGCSGDDGDTGPAGPQGPPGSGPTSTVVEQGDATPGVVIGDLSLAGGTGANGTFRVGDHVSVTFTLEKTNGDTWDITEFGRGRIMLSGPTFNYQRVIPEKNNVATASVQNADGSYTYTFADPIPAVYAAPYNDTASFDAGDGELTGQPLLNGTYTVGLYFGWDFTVSGQGYRDADNATIDFLIGPGPLEAREVVTLGNCNVCHIALQVHGEMRRDVKLCVLCHTAGSEDRNDPNTAGGTPGVTVDFKVMIHKIHNGAHLPSVLGVSTNPDGTRNYGATPTPYIVNSTSNDFSDVHFPVWPSLSIAMPRDQGYSALSAGNKALEDTIRLGVVDCTKCHGDPDGAGPLPAPAQGDLYMTQPTEQACGACHDDIVWGSNYTANGQTMGPQANNTNCVLCHEPAGTPLAVTEAHTHPMYDPTLNPGLNVDISEVAEAGNNDDDGTIDPGEKVAITFTLTDDAGTAVSPSVSSSYSVVMSGPTDNVNLLLSTSIPAGKLSGAQPYTVNLPEPVVLEYVDDSTAGLDTFHTARSPHWNMSGATTTVYVRTATAGGSTTLAEDTAVPQNYVDVAGVANFARDDYVVIDDGTPAEEYSRVTLVDGTRLWLGALLKEHAAGATVLEVTLTQKAATTDYTLTAATGQIDELIEFGNGNAVVVSYTSDFIMPDVYPLPLNASPDIDETMGKWTGKEIADGTYLVALWGARSLTLNLYGESNSYRGTADAQAAEFLVGSATTAKSWSLTEGGATCYSCHNDLVFHGGGRTGWTSCLVCHGTAGSEDRPRYTAGNAPETTGVLINFRSLLHKIHMGEDLANAESYTVNGYGSSAYPNNFTSYTYGEVVFPSLPGNAANCTKCHGDNNTKWYAPTDRDHPTEQGRPVRAWRAVCGECHDSNAAQAHIDVQTSLSGYESCEICHGDGKDWGVKRMHRSY